MTKVKMNKNRDEANVGGMQYFYDKVYRSYAAIQKARCADARKPLSQSSPGEWFVCGRGGPEGRGGASSGGREEGQESTSSGSGGIR